MDDRVRVSELELTEDERRFCMEHINAYLNESLINSADDIELMLLDDKLRVFALGRPISDIYYRGDGKQIYDLADALRRSRTGV